MELKKLLKGFALSLTLSFVFWQCTKIKTTDIGADLIPAVDNVLTFDTTLTLVSNNYLFGDSAVPFLGKDLSGNVPEHVLGHISNDPQFGKTDASIYMELKPPSYPYNFENTQDSLYLDSVVLCLKWNSTWGDTSALQQIGVYALDDQMKSDSVYFTTATFNYTDKLGGKTFAPEILNDSLQLFKQKVANQLRIPLKNSFGNLLLSQSSAAGNPYNNDSAFRAFFKGYAIVPENPGIGGNALMSFAISDTNTCVRLYYRYTKNGKEDTTSRRFIFGNIIPGGNATNITRDYSGSQMQAHLATPAGGDSLLYVQTAPGSYSKLRIPSIDGFIAAKGNVMVHLAELSMIQVPGPANEKDNVLTPPEILYLDYQDTVLKRQLPFLNDAFLANMYDPRVFGGIGKKVVGLNGQIVTGYNFYITRYIQNLITQHRPNFPMFLYAPYTVYYAESRTGFAVDRIAQGRIKLGGGTHSSQKMKLRIIYSKI